MNGRKARALREQARRRCTPALTQPVGEYVRKAPLQILRNGVPLAVPVLATRVQWPARSYRRHVQDAKRHGHAK